MHDDIAELRNCIVSNDGHNLYKVWLLNGIEYLRSPLDDDIG